MVLTGCDPGFHLYGDVVDSHDVPVPGATVVLVCYGADQGSVRTDVKGVFSYSRLGAFGDKCEIQVRFQDGTVLSFDLLSYCVKPYVRHTCTEVMLHVKLDGISSRNTGQP